jgi:hypothetical protein
MIKLMKINKQSLLRIAQKNIIQELKSFHMKIFLTQSD